MPDLRFTALQEEGLEFLARPEEEETRLLRTRTV